MNFEEHFGFCPELVRLYETGFAEGSHGERFGLGGCSSVNNLLALKGLFEHSKPNRSLEIGFCLGGSGLLFTALHQRSGAVPSRQHTGIDPFQISNWKNAGLMAIERAGLPAFLDFRPVFSSLELPNLLSQRATFDLVYIDGSHLFEDVFIDFYYVARLLNVGGIVAFDDCADRNVAKVLAFVERNLKSTFEELDLVPYRLDDGRSLRYRVARLLGKTQLRAFRKIGNPVRNWDAAFANF